MEKKLMIILAVLSMVLGYASTGMGKGPGNGGGSSGTNYVDDDGDGYCDNTGIPFIDEDGDGIHDGYLGGGVGFVDEDGDGICDKTGLPFIDEDGDGYCDNKSSLYRHRNKSAYGYGSGYVDEDGDGVCDGAGIEFIDEDGDGVCDNKGIDRGFFGHGGQGKGNSESPDASRYGNGNGGSDNSGNGSAGSDNETGNGTKGGGCLNGDPLFNILDGTPFTYSGEVVSEGSSGSGMIIATESGEVTINGVGPVWFWDCKDVPRPVLGDVIEVNGYTVDYNEAERNVAVSIAVDGQTIELRNLETGVPLWRGNRRSCE